MNKNKLAGDNLSIENILAYPEEKLSPDARLIKNYFIRLISVLPNNVYWLDRNCITLGCNNNVLKLVGLEKLEDFIGITYERMGQIAKWYEGQAQSFERDDMEVMQTGKPIFNREEPPVYDKDGKPQYYISSRLPLLDESGSVIGVVGTSVNITEREEAERLKDEAVKAKLEAQEKFKKTAFQVAHDITSPVIALTMFTETYADELPEDLRYFLKTSATRINDIAYNLLNQYKSQVTAVAVADEKQEDLLLSSSLLKMLAEKKFQYAGLSVQFDFIAQKKDYFAFIHIQPNAFKRSLSNIINNAVDAFDHKTGAVTLKLDAYENFVHIIIEDNGKGMSEAVRNKILNNLEVTSGKADGHGIGMGQVRETLTHNNGKMQIDSELDKGTKITLVFPRIDAPDWIVDKIHLSMKDTLLILDDDDGIHKAWDKRFGVDAPDIPIKHFTHGQELIDYVNGLSSEQKEKLFLLTDYELLKQGVNGLQVIEKTGLKQAILVTSHFENEEVRKLAAKTNTKILPKPLASEVPIILTKAKTGESRDVISHNWWQKFFKSLMSFK